MLQLVQSPSPRIQRLIKEQCNDEGRVRPDYLSNNEKDESSLIDKDEDDHHHARGTSSNHNKHDKNVDNGGKSSVEPVTGVSSPTKDRDQATAVDQGTSESRVDQVNSYVHSYSSTSQDRKPTSVKRINRMENKGDGFVVASSSISSASPSGNRDEYDSILEEDQNEEEEDNRKVGGVNDGAEDYETQ